MNVLNQWLEQLRTRDPKADITLNHERTAVLALRGNLAGPAKQSELKKTPHKAARRFLRRNKALLGNLDEKKDLADGKVLRDLRGAVHVMLQQKHGNAEVLGCRLSVHFDANGAIFQIKSNLETGVDLPKEPNISALQAAKAVGERDDFDFDGFTQTHPVLMVVNSRVFNPGKRKRNQRHYLCWSLAAVSHPQTPGCSRIYFVDALNGTVRFRYPETQRTEQKDPTVVPLTLETPGADLSLRGGKPGLSMRMPHPGSIPPRGMAENRARLKQSFFK